MRKFCCLARLGLAVLEEDVARWIEAGWEPVGGVILRPGRADAPELWVQTMKLPEESMSEQRSPT